MPELETTVQQAKAELNQWEQSIQDGTYEKDLVWKEFSAKAPDASQVNAFVLDADQKRADFTRELRDYHRMEKSLESTLGRSLKKDVKQKRDELLSQFGRDSYRNRLPGRIRVQAKRQRQSERKAEELKRNLSRGLGLGR